MYRMRKYMKKITPPKIFENNSLKIRQTQQILTYVVVFKLFTD